MATIEFGDNNEKNKDALEAWLEAQGNRELNVAIAHRAAMRVSYEIARIPFVYETEKFTEKLIVRGFENLLESLLMVDSSSYIVINKITSYLDFFTFHNVAPITFSALDSAASSYLGELEAVSSSTFSTLPPQLIWENVRSDIEFFESHDIDALIGRQLFDGEGWDGEAFEAVKKLGDLPEYAFWSKWILESYHGKKRSKKEWEMLRDIALIDKDIWKQGAKAVADKIAEIETDFASKALPIAEIITLNPQSQRAKVEPIAMTPNQRYENVIIKLQRQIKKFKADEHSNQYSALTRVFDDLEEVVTEFANNAGMVHDELVKVRGRLRHLVDHNEVPYDDYVAGVESEWQISIVDIQEAMPEVKASVQPRLKRAWAEASDGERALIERAQEIMPEATEGTLTRLQARDYGKATAGDEKALQRHFARVARIYNVYKPYVENPMLWWSIIDLIMRFLGG